MAELKHSTPAPRRAFLRSLASLPLIGGSIALVGAPTAVAGPATFETLLTYRAWLEMEGRLLGMEMFPHLREQASHFIPIARAASQFHFPDDYIRNRPPAPSTRAALVLAAAGVPLEGLANV